MNRAMTMLLTHKLNRVIGDNDHFTQALGMTQINCHGGLHLTIENKL